MEAEDEHLRAKRIDWVSRAGEPLGPDLVCPRTGRHYVYVGVALTGYSRK